MRACDLSRQPNGCILKSVIICLLLTSYAASNGTPTITRIETDSTTNVDVSFTTTIAENGTSVLTTTPHQVTISPRPTTIANTDDYGHNTTTMSQKNATEIQTSTYSNTTQSHVTPANTTRANIVTTDTRLFFTNITTSVPTIKTTKYKITTKDLGTSHPVITTSFTDVTSNTGSSVTTTVSNQTTHATTIQYLITSTNVTTAIPTKAATTVESVFDTTELPSTHNTKTSAITDATNTTDSGTQMPTTVSSINDSNQTFSTLDSTTDAEVSLAYSTITTQPRLTSDTYTIMNHTTNTTTKTATTTELQSTRNIKTSTITNGTITSYSGTQMPTTISSINDSNQTFSTPDSTTDAKVSLAYSAITTEPRFTSDTHTIINHTTKTATITERQSTRNIKTSKITNGTITTNSGTQMLTTMSSTAESNQTVSTPFNDTSVSMKFTSSSVYTKKTTNDSEPTGPPGTTRIDTDYTTVADVSSTQPRFTSTTYTKRNTKATLAQNSSDTITTTPIVTTNPRSELITTSSTQPYVTTTIVTTKNGDTEHTTTQNQASTTASRTNVTAHIQTFEFSTHSVTTKPRVTSSYTTKPSIATTDVTSTETATTTHYNKTTQLPTTESNFRLTTEKNTKITTRYKLSTHETTEGNTPPTIVCPSDISSTDTSPDWEIPIASDDESPPPEVDCTNNPGDEYPIGSITKVTCTAIDSLGQGSSCSFYITVETVLSEEIANLTKNVNDENVEEVAVELEEIVEKAELEPADVQEVSNALETIANTESPNENVTSAVVGTVDAVIASDSSDSDLPPETTALILESFEQQISTAATDGQNYTQDEDTLSVRTLSFDSNINYDVVFVVNEDKTPDVCFDKVCSSNSKSQSVTLPKDLLSSNEGRTNISFTSFYNPNLFQSGTAELYLSSVIMSATIYNESLPEVFQNPVKLVFNVPKSYSNSNASCVFWNATLDGNGNWSIEGCELINTDHEGSVTCHCTHLTNFAVLFFPNEIPPGVDLFLDLVTYIGCGVSIVCLLLTVITVLSIPSQRKRQPQKIMVSLCVSLICLYTTFIFGVDTANPGTAGCKTVAVLLHYFLLTSVAWTAVEATNMYYFIIQVFDAKKSYFMLISSILAWGLPYIPPIVLLSIDIAYYDNKKYCYLSTTELDVFIYAIIIPIGIVIIFNFIIFVLVINKLFCSSSMATRPLNAKEKKKRLLNAIAISLLLGLTWIFGFLSFENDADIAFLILFCVFNSFQGVAIFYLFCLRQKECKKAWKEWLGINKPKYSYDITLSTSSSKTANDSFTSNEQNESTTLHAVENPVFSNTVDDEHRNDLTLSRPTSCSKTTDDLFRSISNEQNLNDSTTLDAIKNPAFLNTVDDEHRNDLTLNKPTSSSKTTNDSFRSVSNEQNHNDSTTLHAIGKPAFSNTVDD